jgi:hypothetical protein
MDKHHVTMFALQCLYSVMFAPKRLLLEQRSSRFMAQYPRDGRKVSMTWGLG